MYKLLSLSLEASFLLKAKRAGIPLRISERGPKTTAKSALPTKLLIFCVTKVLSTDPKANFLE